MILSVVALLAAGIARGGVVIDDFDAGSIALVAPPSTSATQTGLTGVLGGTRKWTYGALGSAPAGSSVRMTVDTTAGAYRYQADGNLTAVNFGLIYDGGTPTNPALDVDLTAGGATGLALEFAYANFPSGVGHFDISISSKTGATTGGIGFYQPIYNSATPFAIYLPFVAPPGHPGGNTLDPRHFTRFRLGSGNGNLAGGDFLMTGIRAVPEPAGAGVVAGAMSMARRTRRGRREFDRQ